MHILTFCSHFLKFMLFLYVLTDSVGVDGAGLVSWVTGPPDASFRFYLREAFQSQTNTERILYNNSR